MKAERISIAWQDLLDLLIRRECHKKLSKISHFHLSSQFTNIPTNKNCEQGEITLNNSGGLGELWRTVRDTLSNEDTKITTSVVKNKKINKGIIAFMFALEFCKKHLRWLTFPVFKKKFISEIVDSSKVHLAK